jgi:hypothetical protein
MAIAVSNSGGNDHHDFHNGLSEVNRGETYPGSFKLQRVDKSNMHLPSSNKDMHIYIYHVNSWNKLLKLFTSSIYIEKSHKFWIWLFISGS